MTLKKPNVTIKMREASPPIATNFELWSVNDSNLTIKQEGTICFGFIVNSKTNPYF
jgi:hypothetical protein